MLWKVLCASRRSGVTYRSPHTAENEPSGFKSKHQIFFRNILICRLLSYNLNFQKLLKSSAFLSLISIVSVGSKINQDYSVFFAIYLEPLMAGSLNFVNFKTFLAKKSKPLVNCIIAQLLPKKRFFKQIGKNYIKKTFSGRILTVRQAVELGFWFFLLQ